MKLASKSFGTPYQCKMDWPEDCQVQCGDNGVVFTKGTMQEVFNNQDKTVEALKTVVGVESKLEHYRTAFFEAFPKNPDTFIRGEGSTVEEAEEKAWKWYQKIINCKNHEFEKRNYKNGCGICKHCGLFASDVFEPSETCSCCGKKTYYTQDKKGKWYCEDCRLQIPEEDRMYFQKIWFKPKEELE